MSLISKIFGTKAKKPNKIEEPEAITSVVPQPFWGYGNNLASLVENPFAHLYSWSYIFSKANSSRLATFPLQLMVPEKKNARALVNVQSAKNSFVTVEDQSHPVLYLLQHPNKLSDGYNLFYTLYIDLQIIGDAFIFVSKDEQGVPNGLIRLDPVFMEVVPSTEEWGIKHYWYQKGNQNKIFQPDQIIHILIPDPNSELYGKGVLEGIITDLNISEEKLNMDLSYYKNKSRADIIAAFKGNVSQDAISRFCVDFENKLRGSSRDSRIVGVNADKVDIVPLQQAAHITGDPEVLIRKISLAYSFPYSKFTSTNSTKASMMVTMAEWSLDLKTYSDLMARALTNQLLPMFSELDAGAKIQIESLQDEESDEYVDNLWKNKMIDLFEARQMYNLPVDESMKGQYYAGQANIGQTPV